jgi:hypothetical protein
MLKILIPLCSFFVVAQQPVFDGFVSAEEWKDAQQYILQRIYCTIHYELSI